SSSIINHSLHVALPICPVRRLGLLIESDAFRIDRARPAHEVVDARPDDRAEALTAGLGRGHERHGSFERLGGAFAVRVLKAEERSEEHTSELQSRENLV